MTLPEAGGGDLTKIRMRAKEVHDTVTALLHEDEVRTEVRFADGQHGIYRWRRTRLRGWRCFPRDSVARKGYRVGARQRVELRRFHAETRRTRRREILPAFSAPSRENGSLLTTE